MTPSLITDEARSKIGTEIDLRAFTIGEADVARYAAAIGSEKGPARVQPLLYTALSQHFQSAQDLTIDGLIDGTKLPIGNGNVMFGGIDLEIVRPLKVGETITGIRRLHSLDEKQGRNHRFVIATWHAEFSDDTGAVVLRENMTELLM